MTLPPEVMDDLVEIVGVIDESVPVGGGCIGSARRIVAGGDLYFLKYGRSADGFFGAEVEGLEALRGVAENGGDIRIPRVIGTRDEADGIGWILLEWLDSATAQADDWDRLATGLAAIHRVGSDLGWGWERDGFIGSLRQSNRPAPTWAEFWIDRRLRPQLALARGVSGIGSPGEWDRLFGAAPQLLEPAERDGPSYIHGDLWSGNVLMTAGGPALVDPAFYRGHREVDLAMAALFGGFPNLFRASYDAIWPPPPGYEVRERVYQLYYLLVHVNLFGASYAPRTARTLRSVLASL